MILWKTQVVSGNSRRHKLLAAPCGTGTFRVEIIPMELTGTQTRMDDDEYLHVLRTEFMVSVSDARREAKNLKRYIAKKVLRNRYLRKECKSRKSVRRTLGLRSKHACEQNWLNILPDDYRRLTILSVFVDEAIRDADHGTKYSRKLRSLFNSLSKARCSASQILYATKRELVAWSPAMMPAEYKDMPDQAIRDRRNCMISATARSVLSNMRRWYKIHKV